MKSIKNNQVILLLLLAFLAFNSIKAQTNEFDGIAISGDFLVIPGKEYTYTIVDPITDWTWHDTSSELQPLIPGSSEIISTSVNSLGQATATIKWNYDSFGSGVLIINSTVPWVFLTVSVIKPIEFPEPIGSDQNYVKTSIYNSEGVTKEMTETLGYSNKNESITYIDGIGRPIQKIEIAGDVNDSDIVIPIVYDEFGRATKTYLPYPVSFNNRGAIREDAIREVHEYYDVEKYNHSVKPYAEQIFENSLSGRLIEQGAPGNDWGLHFGKAYHNREVTHSIIFEHKNNTVGNSSNYDNVKRFEVEFINNSKSSPNLFDRGLYEGSQLFKTITKDENWVQGKEHTVEEFKNKRNQTVLKRTYASIDLNNDGDFQDDNESEVAHDTYYVYDFYGNLAYVIPPKVDASVAISQQVLDNLCYQYKYDNRNRLVEKKIPGKAWEYIVYDNLDRPVLTQDYNLRYNINQTPKNKWLFTKYDLFGRVVYTGIYTHNTLLNQNEMQAEIDAFYTDDGNNSVSNLYETKLDTEGNNHFYSNQSFPDTSIEILTVNYYDNYNFQLEGGTNPNTTIFEDTISNKTKTLATGSKVRILNTNKWITSVVYYDEKARPIYAYSKNEFLNTLDITKTQYDFLGKVLKTRNSHTKNNTTITTQDAFIYDHRGRLLDQHQCIGDETLSENCGEHIDEFYEDHPTENRELTESETIIGSQSVTLLPGFKFTASTNKSFTASIFSVPQTGELIVSNTYDELGQLESKKVGNSIASPLQTVDYTYNIRGWLKGINDNVSTDNTLTIANNDLFGFKINYNNPTNGTALYNGNISETQWRTANTDKSLKTYNYQYDALNRITKGIDNTGNYNLGNITNPVTYDKNGNILSLYRKGHTDTNATQFGVMDNLSYIYDAGNKLINVTDAVTSSATGFVDRNINGDNDYDYDDNGNMIVDKNKGISKIIYNHLNLPTYIEIDQAGEGGSISYVYDATGVKLQKFVEAYLFSGDKFTTTQYAGNYVYENNTLKFFSHPEGYIDTTNSFEYVYQFKDHLGNIRLSYSDSDGNGDIDAEEEIIEENNYYPFGLKHNGYNNVVNSTNIALKKKFAGEEFEDELGKNTVAYQWRDYDPAIARFNKIDRFAEKYESMTPYHFAANNPIYFREIAGDSIHLTFDKDATKTQYQTEVNKGTGGFYEVQIDSNGKVTGLTATDKEGEMTKEQKAFYDEYNAVVGSEHSVEMKVWGRSTEVSVGSWALNKIDMADIQAFDKAGEGGSTSAGALIHETVEQHEKVKAGYKPGDLATAGFDAAHQIAIKAENRVNGNTRNRNTYTESDGTVTTQRIIPNRVTGRNTVTKTKTVKP